MRRIAVLVLVAGVAFPAAWGKPPVTKRVTVAQFAQLVAAMRGESDGSAAKQISGMRLTERLDNEHWTQLDARMPGKQSREQLLVLADESAFLQLPESDRLPDPAPGADAQADLLAHAAAYVRDKTEEWPSFSTLRSVTRFEGTDTLIAMTLQDDLGTRMGSAMLRAPTAPNWECPGSARLPSRRLDVIERATLPVIYRRGHEVHAFSTGGEFACTQRGVNTADEFRELHVLIPLVAGKGKTMWSHWEESAEGKIAVFRYVADVNYGGDTNEPLLLMNLSGEIGVNPTDGSIVRLVEIRRWGRGWTTREYDSAVEFGAVAIGRSRLLLPLRRVAMFQTPILKPAEWDSTMEKYYRKSHLEKSPLQEYLNDVRYREYRLYASAGEGAAAGSVAADRR